MTADQRLDQLELLVSEALTVLDRHTAQLKQLTATVGQIITILTQQSDSIAFLLQEHVALKNDMTEMKADIAGLKTDVAGIQTDVAGLKTDVASMQTDVAGLKTDVASMQTDVAEIKSDMNLMRTEFGSKLDLILSKLN
jgi:chromosome segregation ATPase